mmetsp:Transcript_29713/g.76737  ORF Transcript_29713/g.76737 Transcript_29713/m.76737 type:complete len:182 (-) Transcript_29713:265-810(-)
MILRTNAHPTLSFKEKTEIKFYSILFLCTSKYLRKHCHARSNPYQSFMYPENRRDFDKYLDKEDLFPQLLLLKEFSVFGKLHELYIDNTSDCSVIQGYDRRAMHFHSFWFHLALDLLPDNVLSLKAFTDTVYELTKIKSIPYRGSCWVSGFDFYLEHGPTKRSKKNMERMMKREAINWMPS